MSVLVEAHSVIIRCQAVHQRHEGGWQQFVAEVPNRTFCSDGEIARVGFMSPADADAYLRHLGSRGLHVCGRGAAADMVRVFQLGGCKEPCEWLEMLRFSSECHLGTVVGCRLRGGGETTLATPARWKFEGSLSQTFGIFPDPANNPGVKFLRHESGVDVYYDTLAEKEVFVGRTGE